MKRKIGLLVGYNGSNYHGLQWNKDTHTIEKTIIDILLHNNLVTALNASDPRKIDLKASSRTDKGVHASFNIINVKINQELTDELQTRLKEDFSQKGIRLYKAMKLPKKFISYKAARGRLYKYVMPTFFIEEGDFAEEYRRREAEDQEIRRAMGYEAAFGPEESEDEEEMINSDESTDMKKEDACDNDEQAGAGLGGTTGDISGCADRKNGPAGNKSTAGGMFRREYKPGDINPLRGHRSGSLDVFTRAMKKYIGTRSYHNFTLKSSRGGAKRFIKSIEVSEPRMVDDIEYVEVSIYGQSFLLHQIRKMVSFAVLNCRYARNAIDRNFERVFSEEIHVPKAPSQYLFLSHVYFDDFNKKAEEKIEVDEGEKQEFEERVIYPAVYAQENLLEWLKFLDTLRFHHDKFPIFKN